MTSTRPAIDRERVSFTVATDLISWMHGLCAAGGPFALESHAVEMALQRLCDEAQHIRQECRRSGTPFKPAAFWRIFHDLIEASRPIPAGRPFKWQTRPILERERIHVSIDVGLLSWQASHRHPAGPFESPSHTVETALRNLRLADLPTRPVAGLGFSYNGEALWAAYQDALAKKDKRNLRGAATQA